MVRTQLLHAYATTIGATLIKSNDDGDVDFVLQGCNGYVRMKEGGSRIRASVVIAIVDDGARFNDWANSQPWPPSSELDYADLDDGTGALRLVWERSLDGLDRPDPVANEVRAFVIAWRDQSSANIPEAAFERLDPRDSVPEQAWLVVADEVAWPTEETLVEVAQSGEVGIFEYLWTAAKQTQAGDLVLIYFMGERKAIHFVARAASSAFYTSDIEVNSDADTRNEQWWIYLTPPIAVSPIKFAELRDACSGQLILKGRSGKFLHPSAIARLTFSAEDPEKQSEIDRVVRVPVGRADLPDPDSMTWEDVRDLAGGALRIESEVSRYIVEPLLRHCLKGTHNFYPEGVMTYVPEYPIGRKRADFVVLKDGRPVCVVEVKLAINDGGDWSQSPDLMQAIGYARALACPAVLIDASRIVLIDAGSNMPSGILQRRALHSQGLPEGNLHDLAEHLGALYIQRINQAVDETSRHVAVVRNNPAYPGMANPGEVIGKVEFACRPGRNVKERVIGATGPYAQMFESGSLTTFGEFLTRAVGGTGGKIWNWEDEGERLERLPQADRRRLKLRNRDNRNNKS